MRSEEIHRGRGKHGGVNAFVVSIVRARWCALFLYQYFSVCFNILSSRAIKASLS